MSRPQKRGLGYFPLDAEFFSDKKIKILKARYGTDGIMVYLYLLCEIYKNGYYLQWDGDYKYILAGELNLTDGFIEQVLTFLLERSLLDSILFKSDTILTSPGIQRRYQLAVKERAKKTPIEIERFWLLKKEETESYINVTHFDDSSQKNCDSSQKNEDSSRNYDIKKRKVNKSKEKESKEEKIYSPDGALDEAIHQYIDFRISIKKPIVEHGVELVIKKLEKMTSDNDEKIEILNQSIMNGWQGIFPVQSNRKQVNKNNSDGYDDMLRRWASEEK